MTLHWRETLQLLLPQFRAKAANSRGIYHLMVEVANDEREKASGPGWFEPFTNRPTIVDGKIEFKKWDCSRSTGLPGIQPDFREPIPDEQFGASDRVIRDKQGIVRAVPVPMKLRRSYFCGRPPQEVEEFESLAKMASLALSEATDLSDHFLATELCDLFRRPRGGIRYVFGDVPKVPQQFIASGWACGVLVFENGVLIDSPISESPPDASHWMLFLHRLGWRRPQGSPITAHRACWSENTEVAYETLNADWSAYPKHFSNFFNRISKESFYSIIGSKESPIDIYLASAFALQILLSDMTSRQAVSEAAKPEVDYSGQAWSRLPMPSIESASLNDLKKDQLPQVGILVATEVERESVLLRMKPPRGRQSVLQIYEGNNTYFLGRVGVTDAVLVMTAMGSVGRDASTIVTAELIEHWKVNGVVMVGIAFGKDADRQMIGGVLISERVICYEPEHLGKEENQERGDVLKAGSVLLNRFRNVIRWTFADPQGVQCARQVGAILSGEKLVDNAERKAQLFTRHPAAIGGEMEGAGFASAAERKKCEWIVVKAICDWGDGTKKKHHQSFAAAAAIDLVEHVLNQVGALDSLRKTEQ